MWTYCIYRPVKSISFESATSVEYGNLKYCHPFLIILASAFCCVWMLDHCNIPAHPSPSGPSWMVAKCVRTGTRLERGHVLLFRRISSLTVNNSCMKSNSKYRNDGGEVHKSKLVTLTFHVAHCPLSVLTSFPTAIAYSCLFSAARSAVNHLKREHLKKFI